MFVQALVWREGFGFVLEGFDVILNWNVPRSDFARVAHLISVLLEEKLTAG